MSHTGIRVTVRGVVVRNDALLLIAYSDAHGIHYNLPGGGVATGETLHDAVRRELREEACVEVSVGRLLLVYETIPAIHHASHRVTVLFMCELSSDDEPHQPSQTDTYDDQPELQQIGVQWVPLDELEEALIIPLIPRLADRIREAQQQTGMTDVFCADWTAPIRS